LGTLTLTEFTTYIKFNFGNNDAWSTPTDYYTIWFNRAYNRLTTQDMLLGVKRRFYFPQLETSANADTVDGVAYIGVPADCLVIRDLYDTENYRRLASITPRTYLSYTDRADTTAEGEPTEWVRQAAYLYLHPTPDDAYTINVHYRQIPAALSSGASTTAIGAEWDDVLITLASYIGKMWTMDYEKAKMLKEEFKEQAEGIISLYGEEAKAREEFLHVDEVYRDRGY